MEGTNNQVAGDSGLNSDLGGLTVSNLTDHDDIGVLTQDSTEGRCECKIYLRVYVNLIDTIDVRLDRVLNGDDVDVFTVEL